MTNILIRFPLLAALALGADAMGESLELAGSAPETRELSIGAGESMPAFADVTGDGNMDLLVSNLADHDVMVFIGDGRGGLEPAGRYEAGQNPTAMATGDINGDGTLDLAVANHETRHVSVLIGDGSGGYRPAPYSPLNIEVDPHPHAVGLQDFDGDGHVDLVVDNRGLYGLLILRGLGGTGFESRGATIPTGGDPYLGFALADIDADGRIDLVTPNPDHVGVVLNRGDEILEFEAGPPVAAANPFAVAVGDFNGDGTLDVIAASDGRASVVEVFPGLGEGEFSERPDSTFDVRGGAKNIAVGDVNGDGLADALVASWSSDLRLVAGSHDALQAVVVPLEGIDNPWGLALGDLNGDGRDDFIVTDGSSERAVVFVSGGRRLAAPKRGVSPVTGNG